MTENTTDSTQKQSWKCRYRGGFLLGLGLVVAMFIVQRVAMNLTMGSLDSIGAKTPLLLLIVAMVFAVVPMGLIAWVHQRIVLQGRLRFASGMLHALLLNVALWVAVVGQLYAMSALSGCPPF